jgi:D-alanyl-D-alanine carboxypeptidase
MAKQMISRSKPEKPERRSEKEDRKNSKRTRILFLTVIIFATLFIPGQNFYQTLNPRFIPPLTREINSYPVTHDYPRVLGNSSPQNISAESAIVIDVDSGVPIFQKNPNERLKPASTTKIMTAIIALENYRQDQILRVNILMTEGAQMGLRTGDELTVENLLKGTLINSGNDAAFTLAESFPGGIEKFIYSMNEKARELNMRNTQFTNINGFDNENHYTTSIDLARLSVYALRNPLFKRIVGTAEDNVSNITGTHWYPLKNVNQLLDKVPGVKGVKTGFTQEAGECLVAEVERSGRRIVTVVLKSTDRFGETKALIDWAFKETYWERPSLKTPEDNI